MHQGQGRGDVDFTQVRVEGCELVRGQHALVDHGARRQRREVDAQLVLYPLAQRVHAPVEVESRGGIAGIHGEDLPEIRHALSSRHSDKGWICRHMPPTEDLDLFVAGDLVDLRHQQVARRTVRGKESDTRGVGAGLG